MIFGNYSFINKCLFEKYNLLEKISLNLLNVEKIRKGNLDAENIYFSFL